MTGIQIFTVCSFYAKNPEQLPDSLIDEVLGCGIPMSAKSQKETFQAIVEETLGENCDFETVKNIHENLSELVEETKDEPVPLTLDKYQVRSSLKITAHRRRSLRSLRSAIRMWKIRRKQALWQLMW